MNTMNYIMLVAELDKFEGGTGSDYSVAKLLGIKPNTISRYRCHNGTMDNKTAYIAAEMLQRNPLLVICEMNAQCARTRQDQDFW